jgi:hypothetical protein
MARLVTTRDVYGPIAEGGPITRTRTTPRRLSAPRERTLTELGLHETTAEGRHESLLWRDADEPIEIDCGE